MPLYPALSMMTGWGAEKVLKKYTIVAISMCAFASLSYLSIDKGILDLDYSPKIKQTAITVKNVLPRGEELYVYDVSDPGMQFYLGDIAENVREEKVLNNLLAKKNNYILLNKRSSGKLSGAKYSVALDRPDFLLIKTK
jgi:hypothetical protein